MTMVLSGSAGVTFPNNDVQATGALGVGQTWQDMTASRSSGVTYTNTTGRPITVSLGVNCSASGVAYTYVYINGLNMNYVGQGSGASPNTLYSSIATFIVPAGNTYSIATTGNLTVAKWMELR